MTHTLLCSYWISQRVRTLTRVLLDDRWQERHKFYVDEILVWFQNRLPISHEDVYQKVNSSVDNAINSQVGKTTTCKDIRQSPFQIPVFHAVSSCIKWCCGGRDENYAWAKHGLPLPQADPATATALCLICTSANIPRPIIKYLAQGTR